MSTRRRPKHLRQWQVAANGETREKILGIDWAQFGVDELRRAVRLLNNTSESFNQQWSAEDLIKIWRAYNQCGFDVTPDRWTHEMISAAVAGYVPTQKEFEALGY